MKTRHPLAVVIGKITCAAAIVLALPVWAQMPADRKAELEQAWREASDKAQTGPVSIKLRDQATLQVPAHEAFIPQPAAGKLIRAMGNSNDERLLGLVMPTGDADWMVIAKYEPSGYIRDDDARDWNVDDLFKSLKDGTDQGNIEREKRGIPAVDLQGWVERPHYDAATHRLVWSMAMSERGAPANAPQGVNYNTYALGREGYVSLNLVTPRQNVEADKLKVQQLLANLDFDDGKRYADFNGSTDRVAEYGLAALVGGVAAKKLGLLAVIAAFVAKFAKVIGVAVAGFGYAVSRRFKKNKSQA
ncbi:DUF2167 domain-containing protein [Cupriavidus pauculus]|uniref:DUF2167 domain-containing protein n=1 Tax=Cupriavidus pauculus TaxID=82633 RepID=A0A2N5C2E4_9BURK|nr:DUF2167 domain-containing protein [Cupriavidus pauculus]PLP96383.1 DUF2167 domain-containing protein [Cupriavidus pauculus]